MLDSDELTPLLVDFLERTFAGAAEREGEAQPA